MMGTFESLARIAVLSAVLSWSRMGRVPSAAPPLRGSE